MEQSTQKNGLTNLLTLMVVGAAGFAAARVAGSLAGQVSAVFIGLGAMVAAVSWFQTHLEENERLEKLEFDELLKSKGGSALFESKDAESFPAQRSREQFERFFVPAFTTLLILLQAGGAYLLWSWLARPTTFVEIRQPITPALLFLLFAFVLFLLGRFGATMARLENLRLLRPGASHLLLNAFLCFVVMLGLVGVWADFPKTDLYLAFILCGLLALISLETLVSLILEIYRPRLKGKVERPLYESRLVGLLGQPEGLITTAAQALDYQFGFKVSETWFYRFFERALAWLLLLQLAVLFLSTGIVFIESGEQGLLERFGRPVQNRTLLEAGPHFKWPWPIDRVYRFRTDQIQSFNVGSTPDPRFEYQQTVLWTVPHSQEDNFLVASRDPVAARTANDVSGRRAPPVSLLTVSIPVQFQISNLLAWAYNNDDPTNLLQNIATREVVRYCVSADLNEIMSRGRADAAETLRQRIQAAADERRLGAHIVFVGLQDIHPPMKVAPDYEKVVGAIQTKQAKILAAQADDIKTNALAGAQATNFLNQASADSTLRVISAMARAALFTNQIPAYAAAPAVYTKRAYLQMFARATVDARKFILLTTNTQDVFVFDLQDKIRADLLGDLNVTPKAK
jgi:regulator of protease activity HflC (stomatin/prohibitin superfamily)